MNTKGYTLLFTVLVVSIILAITIGISRTSYTELALSSVAREGAVAFFAADTGYECALIHDLNTNPFISGNSQTFTCMGETISSVSNNDIHQFTLEPVVGKSCSQVTVEKDFTDPNTGNSLTRIQSVGFNRPCIDINTVTNDPTVVQRAVEIYYQNGSGQGSLSGQGQGGNFPPLILQGNAQILNINQNSPQGGITPSVTPISGNTLGPVQTNPNNNFQIAPVSNFAPGGAQPTTIQGQSQFDLSS